LRRADPPFKGPYRLCKNDSDTEEEAKAQQRAVEPLVNELKMELADCPISDFGLLGYAICESIYYYYYYQ
jgi:hypothetical protein